MRKTITVFGSSLPVEGEEEYSVAYKLGGLLAKNNFDVCTGGYMGIMEAVSRGAVENGGKAEGVTLSYLNFKCNNYLTNNIKCSTLFERITTLIEKGDAYIILQGGTGTLLELAAVWEFMNKNLLNIKPIVCHSYMWKEVARIIDEQIVKEKRISGLVKYFDAPEEIADYLVKNLKD
ncbi:MAG: LOG family protein [Ignavibacteriaceae bacterium]